VRRFVDFHFSWGLGDDHLERYSNAGLVDEEMRRRFEVVVPHVRRALLIGKVIDLPKVEAAAFADMLDGLSVGLFLVGAGGRIVYANASGHALAREGGCLSAHGGRLRAADPDADHSLRHIFSAAEGGDPSVGVKGIAVPLKSRDGERYVAHVLPLTAGARRKTGTSYAAVAAVFVRKAELDLQSPFEAIAQDFQLTPAELRVLFAIVDVGGVPEVAPVLGISETTVKTHLQRLFEKTMTRRQADLVKLVAGYTSPLAVGLGANRHDRLQQVDRLS
jgi:DNA-binding CsgD family transcriptional regulator